MAVSYKGSYRMDLGWIKLYNYRKCFNLQQLLNLTSFLLLKWHWGCHPGDNLIFRSTIQKPAWNNLHKEI